MELSQNNGYFLLDAIKKLYFPSKSWRLAIPFIIIEVTAVFQEILIRSVLKIMSR